MFNGFMLDYYLILLYNSRVVYKTIGALSRAAVAESVDALDSKSGALFGRAGSSPARGTRERSEFR